MAVTIAIQLAKSSPFILAFSKTIRGKLTYLTITNHFENDEILYDIIFSS